MTQLSKHQVDAFGHVAVVMGGAAAQRDFPLRRGTAHHDRNMPERINLMF